MQLAATEHPRLAARPLGPGSVTGTAVLASSAVTLAFALAADAPAVLVLHLLLLAGGAFAFHRRPEELRLFLTVYATNVLASLALYFVYADRYDLPYFIGGSDDLYYEQDAAVVARALPLTGYGSIRGGVVSEYHNSVGYVYLVSLLYRLGEALGGFHTLLPRLVNGCFLALLGIAVARSAVRHYRLPPRWGYHAGLAIGLLPIMMYNAAHTFRDTLVALLMFVLVSLWSDERPLARLPLKAAAAAVLLPVLWELRNFSAAATLVLIAGATALAVRHLPPSRRAIGWTFLAVLGAATVYAAVRAGAVNWFVERAALYYVKYSYYRGEVTSDGLAAHVFGAPEPLSSLLRLAYLAVTPLPVLSPEPDRIWLSLGTLVQIFFIPFVLIALYDALARKRNLPAALAFSSLYAGLAVFSFSPRQVGMFLPFGVLLACQGLHFAKRKGLDVTKIAATTCFALSVAAVAYLYLKYT